MTYRTNSKWNDLNELKSYIIFKKLETNGFLRGEQIVLCRELAKESGLKPGSISAKVCNYKSLEGRNNTSNASTNSIRIYNKYKSYSLPKLLKIKSI